MQCSTAPKQQDSNNSTGSHKTIWGKSLQCSVVTAATSHQHTAMADCPVRAKQEQQSSAHQWDTSNLLRQQWSCSCVSLTHSSKAALQQPYHITKPSQPSTPPRCVLHVLIQATAVAKHTKHVTTLEHSHDFCTQMSTQRMHEK